MTFVRLDRVAQHVLADGRGGITTQIAAQYVLDYLAMGRGDWEAAGSLLQGALAQGEQMAELQWLSPPLWGLAETARRLGHYDTTLMLCERGYQASADVTDAAYLFPYQPTGVRAHLAHGDIDAAENWPNRVGAVLTARAMPGTLPAIDHGRALILLARGDVSAAHQALESASDSWRAGAGSGKARGPGWTSQKPPPGHGAAPRRPCAPGGGPHRRRHSRCHPLTDTADRLTASFDHGRPAGPWHPLSAREFEIAQLVGGRCRVVLVAVG